MDIEGKCYIRGKSCFEDLGEYYLDMNDVRNKLRLMAKIYSNQYPFYNECFKISDNLYNCDNIETSKNELYLIEERFKNELIFDKGFKRRDKVIDDYKITNVNVMKRLSDLYVDNSLRHSEQREILKDLSRHIKEFLVLSKLVNNDRIKLIAEYHLDPEYYKKEDSEEEDSDEDD